MAIAITKVTGADYTAGNKRVKVRDLVFSGNYATGGEQITAAQVGLRRITEARPHSGVAVALDLATANPVSLVVNSAGTSVTVTQYEGSAAGTALSEKTNSEAYATGSYVRATFVGN